MKFIYFFTLIGLVSGKYQNHNSCYDILDTWWGVREHHKIRTKTSSWDKTCVKFNGDKLACVNKGGPERQVYHNANLINDYERDKVPCVMLGAHSNLCVANPCNHYNTGHCTVQETGGLCNWYTKKQAKKYNIGYGCHRNPCHIGGEGATKPKDCKARGIPGFIECTYCKGRKDKKLKNKGMGCQRVDVFSSSQCAPVNSKIPPDETVWQYKSSNNCQCTDLTIFCVDELFSKAGKFEKKYP